MTDDPSARRMVGTAILWLAVCAGSLCVALLGVMTVSPRSRPMVEIDTAYVALVSGQMFWMVFLWPLMEHGAPRGRGRFAEVADMLVRLVALLLLSAPLVLVSRLVSDVGWGEVVRGQVLVFWVGAAAGGAIRLPGAVAWYYPAAFVLSAVVPLANYLLYEGSFVSTAVAAALSPFWAGVAAASGDGGSAALVVFAALGIGCAVLRLLFGAGPRPEHA